MPGRKWALNIKDAIQTPVDDNVDDNDRSKIYGFAADTCNAMISAFQAVMSCPELQHIFPILVRPPHYLEIGSNATPGTGEVVPPVYNSCGQGHLGLLSTLARLRNLVSNTPGILYIFLHALRLSKRSLIGMRIVDSQSYGARHLSLPAERGVHLHIIRRLAN
jgi:hypothetical protein